MKTTPIRNANEVSPEPSVTDAESEGFATKELESSMEDADIRREAERAIQTLVDIPSRPAVLLAKDWHVLGASFEFEHLDIYQEAATRANGFVMIVDRPEAGGREHLLFITRTPGLSDKQLLDCMDGQTASTKSA